MRDYADIFKALADETRLAILALLLEHGELCVCDVESVLGISQSKASRHLRYLKNAGLVEDRREGTWVHYRVPEEPGDEAGRVLEAAGRLIASLLPAGIEKSLEERLRDRKACGDTCGG